MKKFLVGFASFILASVPASAADAFSCDGVCLQQVTMDYARYQDGSRVLLYPQGSMPKERLNLGLDLEWLSYGYMNNTIHSGTDQNQFKTIGWQYQIGVHLGDIADVYTEHYSQHLLDERSGQSYPVENLIGIKFYLYRRH